MEHGQGNIALAVGLSILFLVAVIFFQSITGLVTAPTGERYEALITVEANASQQYIEKTITFGGNKPKICKNGIYVTNGTHPIEFKVINETYESGVCASAVIRFTNQIYEG